MYLFVTYRFISSKCAPGLGFLNLWLQSVRYGVAIIEFPIQVDFFISKFHIIEPLFIPLVEFGRPYSRYDRAKGSMGTRTV